jgi:hypothetical protein
LEGGHGTAAFLCFVEALGLRVLALAITVVNTSDRSGSIGIGRRFLLCGTVLGFFRRRCFGFTRWQRSSVVPAVAIKNENRFEF